MLELANTLRRRGVDCWIDQFETSLGVGWPRWMEQEIEKADKVLVVSTPTYLSRVKQDQPLSTGKGVRWESPGPTPSNADSFGTGTQHSQRRG